MSAVAKPEPFSSVILLREAQPHGVEVFLTRRPDELPVIGGKYCFPGGAVYKSDHAANILRRCRGLSGERARKVLGAHFAPPEALGCWIAAIRVLFEEIGILFAVKENGEPITWSPTGKPVAPSTTPVGRNPEQDPPAKAGDRVEGSDAELNLRLLEKCAARRDGALDFTALMERENLFCDAGKFAYFSHWQTPGEFSRSFDARFFLAAVPDYSTPLRTSHEVAHSLWLSPDRALQLFAQGELPMAFPTFASLRTLADFDDVSRLLKEFQTPLAISKRATETSGSKKSV